MEFGHEKLDVYQASLLFACFVLDRYDNLNGKYRELRDQLIRASQSIPLNIAEGNGKWSRKDSARYFLSSRGSTMECAAALDILGLSKGLPADDVLAGKELLHRIASMLSKLIASRATGAREDSTQYNAADYDHDYDYDEEEEEEPQAGDTRP